MGMNNKNQLILEKVETLINEAENAQHRNIDEALSISFEALKISKKYNLYSQAANSYVMIGRCYWINGSFEKAIEYFEIALDQCNEFQGDYMRVEAIIGIGNVYTSLEMFDLALTNYNQALTIAEEQGFDLLVSKTLNNSGALHEDLKNDQIALDYYHKSLIKSLEIDDYYGICIAKLNIGNMNFNLGHMEEAKKYLAEAVDYAKGNRKTLLLAHAYFTLGSMSQERKEFQKSIEEFIIAVDMALESKDSKILFLIYIQLAESYISMKSFDDTEIVYKKAVEVANQIGLDELKVTVYEKMASFYHEYDDTRKALAHYKKYNDAIKSVEENRVVERKKTIDYLSRLSDSMEETKVFQSMSNELKRSYNNMKILSEIGQTMTSTHEIETIFDKLYDDINSLMNAETLSVSLHDPKENVLRFDLSIERGKYLESHKLSLDNENSFNVWSFLNKETIKVNDVKKDYKKYIKGIASTEGDLMYSVMVAPLIVEGDVIGVFSIQAKERNAYTEAHKVLLQTLASYLAISIKNATKTKQLAKLNRILKTKSERDGLTGIPNRRLFDERYEELYNHSIELNKVINVMIIDIDDFKEFNDQFGHLIGDEVIKAVANLLDEHIGNNGFVARYGGDEFVAILPNVDKEALNELDKNLRRNLRKVNGKLGIETEVTVSIGVASTIPTTKEDSEKLVYTADNLLYKSKADGKNTSSFKTI